MKKAALFALIILAAAGVKAQNCEAIMLPYFGGDAARMQSYPAEKLDWRCRYARNAFYESDTVPAGAEMRLITEVTAKADGRALTKDLVVDLATLSYYAYNFFDIQMQYKSPMQTVCFPTPSSTHPYLVLRSVDEMYRRTEFPEEYKDK